MSRCRFDLIDLQGRPATPLTVIERADYPSWLEAAPETTRRWLVDTRFKADAGSFSFLPAGGVETPTVLAVVESADSPWVLSGVATALPSGRYELAAPMSSAQATGAALSWALARYGPTGSARLPRQYRAAWPSDPRFLC